MTLLNQQLSARKPSQAFCRPSVCVFPSLHHISEEADIYYFIFEWAFAKDIVLLDFKVKPTAVGDMFALTVRYLNHILNYMTLSFQSMTILKALF